MGRSWTPRPEPNSAQFWAMENLTLADWDLLDAAQDLMKTSQTEEATAPTR